MAAAGGTTTCPGCKLPLYYWRSRPASLNDLLLLLPTVLDLVASAAPGESVHLEVDRTGAPPSHHEVGVQWHLGRTSTSLIMGRLESMTLEVESGLTKLTYGFAAIPMPSDGVVVE